MTNPRFADLLTWDLRHACRNPLLWLVLLVLGASLIWGAQDTARLHRAQTEAQMRTIAAESAHRASMEARAAAYRVPASPEAPEVPYWQDPTNVSGFSQYFVFQNALKPHFALSPLAAGVSDISPSRLEIKLNTLFGFEDSYDFENPRGLALGRFDMGFALTYLLPVALILIIVFLTSFERDRGLLRMMASQGVTPRLWLQARLGAIAIWTIPAIVLEILVALAVARVPLAFDSAELLVALLACLGYVALWFGIAALVLHGLPPSSSALGTLASIWAALAIGLPLFGGMLASTLDPAPSTIAYVNERRATNDAVQAEREVILRNGLAQSASLPSGREIRTSELDYATQLTFLVPEMEKRLAPMREEMTRHASRQARLSLASGYVALPLGMANALAVLAGSDPQRQMDFQEQSRAYQLKLREVLYPEVQNEVVSPSPRAVPALRGRYSRFDRNLPGFSMLDKPVSERIWGPLSFGVWCLLLGASLTAWGLMRARDWPADL